jgi:hypothetical protein
VSDRLALCNRELVQLVSQQVPSGVGMRNAPLPRPRLWLGAGSWLALLLDLLPVGAAFPPPSLSCAQTDDLGLIRVQSALALPRSTRPPLQALRVLRGEDCSGLVLGLCPALMPGRPQRRRLAYVAERLPGHGLEPIGPDPPGGARLQTPTRQRRLPATRIGEIRIRFPDALWPVAHQSHPTLPTCPEAAPPGAAGGGLRQRVGQDGVAWPWHLRVVKQRGGEKRGGGAPHPRGCWSIPAAGFARVALGDIACARARRAGLTIVVTGLSGRDAGGQERAARGWRPDLGETCGRRRMRLVQGCGHVPTTAGRVDPQPIEAPHDVRCPRLTQHWGGRAVAFGPRAVPVTAVSPGEEVTAAGFRQAPTTRALEHLGALIRGDHPLPLGQPLALRGVATGLRQTAHGRVEVGERRAPEPLMGIMARQPVR